MSTPKFGVREKGTPSTLYSWLFTTAAEANDSIHPSNVPYFEVVKIEMKEVITPMKPEIVWVEAK